MSDGDPTKILFPELHEMAKKPMDWEGRCKKLQLVLANTEHELVIERETTEMLRGIVLEVEATIAKRWKHGQTFYNPTED